MNNKTILIITTLLILATTLTTATAVDLSTNTTIELGDVKIDVPLTNNNTTNEYKVDPGTTWSYEDYQNDISVYVQDFYSDDLSTQKQYDELLGYYQTRPVGDKWVTVYAPDSGVMEAIWCSARSSDQP